MIKPMLCQIASEPFNDPRYIWENKFDGIRAVAEVNSSGCRLWGRNGREKTDLFPEIDLKTKAPAVLDGELVCYTEGKIHFNGIQHRANRVNNIGWASRAYPATYEVFDILEAEFKGQKVDLQRLPLMKRKEILEAVLIPTHNVKVAYYTEDGLGLYQQVEWDQGEGVVGKLKTGTYQQGKREWLKVKVPQWGEFVICGFTEGTGWRASTFGALLLGKYDGKDLTYVGSVGTGFNENEIITLYNKFLTLITSICPFGREPEKATWLKPVLVAKIKYLEVTNDGKLRFPSYKGMI